MIEAKVTNAETANGYIATIEQDGKTVYNSEVAYPHHGIFPDAATAQGHADAWAARLLELPGRIDTRKAEVAIQTCEEGVILGAQILEDAKAETRAKKSAKNFKDSIDQRRERLTDIQGAPAAASMKIAWANRDDPADVKIIAEHTRLDDDFEVYIEDDTRQLSLPQTDWVFTEDDTGVTRIAGYGRVQMRREDNHWIITLGADEHELEAKLDGDVLHTRGRVEEVDDEPAAPPVVFACGKLKDKPLRDRLDMPEFVRPETIIGVYALEIGRKKPRKRVLAKLEKMMQDHKTDEEGLVMAWTELDAGRNPQMGVDRAAAAITTATDDELAEASDRWLEQAVADCGDPMVLSWLINGERDRGDETRDHVITVATERLRALGDLVDGEVDEELAEVG